MPLNNEHRRPPKNMRTRRDTPDHGDTLRVRFLDDCDALETIRCISEAPPTLSRGAELIMSGRAARASRRAVETPPCDTESESDSASAADDSDLVLHQLESAQLEDGGPVRGTAVFGFQRSQRRSHFRRVTEEFGEKAPAKAETREETATTPRRPASGDEQHQPRKAGSGRQAPATPTTRGRGKGSALAETSRASNGATQTPQTPTGVAAKPSAKTPQTVRRQVKLRLSKLKQEDIAVSDDDDDSDVSSLEDSSEDEYKPKENEEEQETDEEDEEAENDEEESDDDRVDTAEEASVRAVSRVSRGGGRRRLDPEPCPASAEDYFSLHSGGGPTSNHTLSRLSEPQLSGAALRALLSAQPPDHAAERVALLADIDLMFPHWMAALCHGFNVLLHGLGSKRSVLERLRRDHLRHRLHMVVNGFHPSVTPRQLLQTLLEDALGVAAPSGSLDAQLEMVLRRFSGQGCERLFLVVHSLDGPMMRGERLQQLLARLAQAPRVHLLASVDHINAPLVWDQHKLAQFNFLWFDATTLQPYTEETSYENSLLVRQTAELALSSLRHVFKSLTPNARGIFTLLVQNQVERAGDRSFEGMPLSELYQRCRDAFLVSSQVALRAQLTEFRDHKLIRCRQSHDGVELLTVPLDTALITEFLADCEDS